MQTRDLTAADLDAVTEITNRCNRAYEAWAPPGWAPPREGIASEREGWARILADGRAWGLLALDASGRAVGVAAAQPPAELRRLFVDPAAQGRGIGSALLRGVEHRLAGGVDEAVLWAVKDSPAIGFYEGRGWRADGRTGWHDELELPLLGMAKRL
jgi:GNAT superfamily N-acetyltransferase